MTRKKSPCHLLVCVCVCLCGDKKRKKEKNKVFSSHTITLQQFGTDTLCLELRMLGTGERAHSVNTGCELKSCACVVWLLRLVQVPENSILERGHFHWLLAVEVSNGKATRLHMQTRTMALASLPWQPNWTTVSEALLVEQAVEIAMCRWAVDLEVTLITKGGTGDKRVLLGTQCVMVINNG